MVKVSEVLRSTSRFLTADDVRDGDVLEIVDEGRFISAEESPFGRNVFQITVRLPDGAEKTWNVNNTTLRTLAQAFGDDTVNWRGRKVRVEVREQVVRGVPRRVIYGYPVAEPVEPPPRAEGGQAALCLLYTSPSPRDRG